MGPHIVIEISQHQSIDESNDKTLHSPWQPLAAVGDAHERYALRDCGLRPWMKGSCD